MEPLVFDLCFVSSAVNDEINDNLPASLSAQGYKVLSLGNPDAADADQLKSMTSTLLDLLPNVRFGLLVTPTWRQDGFASYAVASAVALGVPVMTVAESGTDLGPHLFTADAGMAALDSVLLAAEPVAGDDVTPDEDRSERPHEEAARIVLGPRGAFYDHPYDNFARTGLIWSGVLFSKLKPGEIVEPEDVSLCMVGVKMAREAYRHKRDNLTDGHGYWMTHEMVVEERARRERNADRD